MCLISRVHFSSKSCFPLPVRADNIFSHIWHRCVFQAYSWVPAVLSSGRVLRWASVVWRRSAHPAWTSSRCWSLSSCAISSSVTCLSPRGSSSTPFSSSRSSSGQLTSNFSGRSTAGCPTASPAVRDFLLFLYLHLHCQCVCVCVTVRTSYMGSLRLLVYAKILWFVSVCFRFEMSILSSLLKNYFLNE